MHTYTRMYHHTYQSKNYPSLIHTHHSPIPIQLNIHDDPVSLCTTFNTASLSIYSYAMRAVYDMALGLNTSLCVIVRKAEGRLGPMEGR